MMNQEKIQIRITDSDVAAEISGDPATVFKILRALQKDGHKIEVCHKNRWQPLTPA